MEEVPVMVGVKTSGQLGISQPIRIIRRILRPRLCCFKELSEYGERTPGAGARVFHERLYPNCYAASRNPGTDRAG